ncbi:MAG: M13 family metallopeptidase [Candidatus Paceibacteria bacterium]
MHPKLGFKTSNLDRSVRPQDDFFQFAGGGWIKKNPIPKSESKWGTFYILRDESLKKTHAVFKDLVKKRNLKKGSGARLVRDFYLSGMDMKTRNALGVSPVLPLLKKIDAIKTKDELLRFIFTEHRHGNHLAWNSFVGQDDKDAETYIFHLTQGGLTLPDRDYYLKKDAESERIRKEFLSYMQKLLMLSGFSKAKAKEDAYRVLSLETRLARASMPRTDARDIDKVYNKKSVAALKRLAPAIPWKEYFETLKIERKVSSLVIYQPKFFEKLSGFFERVSLESWKTYLYFSVLDDAAPLLSKKYVECAFSFHGKVLSGNETVRPLWKRVSSALDMFIGEAVGKEYVKRYFPPEAKKKANDMVDDIFTAYEKHIEAITWMSAKTKKKALKKLSLITRKLGYPDKWKSYKGLVVRPDTYYKNVVNAVRFEQKRNLSKLGKNVDRKEWFMPPQTVSAYYDPNMNQIVFPAGILQPPFFDPNGDDALNYGAIGSVIGHELTHGFDDSGAKFDGYGNYRNWWTKEDRKRFERRANALVRQFNKYTVGNLQVNGKLTLGENIADLGGLAIAYDAFQLHLKKHGGKRRHGFTPEQRYFLGLAMFETAHARPEFERMLVIIDPHSPAKYRVNGPLSNLESFYKAFNVVPGDRLYRPPSKRARIW